MLEACNVADEERLNQVVGMGKVPSARDLPKYANLPGIEPEIQTASPAWVIQFNGEIPQFRPVGEVGSIRSAR